MATVENRMEVPKKLKTKPPHNPAILPLGIYLKKTKPLIQKDISTPVLTVAPFTIAKIRKQSKYL